MTVALQLIRERRKRGLTQAEVAARMGTTQSSLSRVEAGRVSPTVDFLERYAAALGQSVVLSFREPAVASRRDRARRVRRVLGDYRFNPWDRDPAPAEQRSLEADGLTRDRFGTPPPD